MLFLNSKTKTVKIMNAISYYETGKKLFHHLPMEDLLKNSFRSLLHSDEGFNLIVFRQRSRTTILGLTFQ